MKSFRFWKMEVKQLSLTERIFFCDAIKTLFTWDLIREEYKELDFIKRILESEIRIVDHEPSKKIDGGGSSILRTHHRETRQ